MSTNPTIYFLLYMMGCIKRRPSSHDIQKMQQKILNLSKGFLVAFWVWVPNTAVSSGLAASSGLGSLSSPVDFSDPAQVASLHPNFRQPSLASHLTKATPTAITNGEYVDFVTLLPMTSLLTDTMKLKQLKPYLLSEQHS